MEGTNDGHHFCLNVLSLENPIGFSKRVGIKSGGVWEGYSIRAARAVHKEIGRWVLYTFQRPAPHPVSF